MKRINKHTRKKVERLYQLAAEMKAEVDKTDSTNVLAVNLLKKAEEKRLKNWRTRFRKRSKG